jgi:hypothetical protein
MLMSMAGDGHAVIYSETSSSNQQLVAKCHQSEHETFLGQKLKLLNIETC